jgi:outer membrane protein
MVRLVFFTLFSLMTVSGIAQDTVTKSRKFFLKLTLDEVIKTARDQSPAAMLAKFNFIAGYWQYRTYKAEFLPSLNLEASLGTYNRSLSSIQNAETGTISYIENNNLSNDLSLSVDQNIALTGGKLSLSTSLYRIDQFSPYDNHIYNSQPISLLYSQPIKAYNTFKWDKIVEPKEFEKVKRVYIENMEAININVTKLFFTVLTAQKSLEMAENNYTATEQSVKIAENRYKIGSITNSELLQLKLRLYNDKLSISDCKMNFEMAMLELRSYLGYNETVNIELIMPGMGPDIQLDYTEVLSRALNNSSNNLENELQIIAARQAVAKAKSNVGLQASFYASFGTTQKGNDLSESYKNPMDQELLGLSLSLPILDWGLGRGKIKLAKSKEEVVKTQIEQAEAEYRQNIMIQVLQFNKQGMQCNISAKADSVARLRYDITMQRFQNGSITVTDLNTAQTEKDEAVKRYISDLSNYWQYFYTIRELSLYDFVTKKEITTDFNLLTEN